MAVDLFRSFQKMDKSFGTAAGSTEMKTIEEQLLRILQSHNQQIQLDFKSSSASTSKPVVNRTGHARFRRGPSDPSTSSQSESKPSTPTKSNPNPIDSKLQTKISESEECKSTNTPISSGSSSITGEEGTVSNGKIGLLASVTGAVPRTFSAGKPPLPTSHRKRSRERELSQGASAKHSISPGCHCCKRRKTVVKREIRRVTTEGSIPADKYSWKKYDQKLIPGTPFPRGYYKCNSAKGCPARKHVERTHGDPKVLIVTYEGEHRHRP